MCGMKNNDDNDRPIKAPLYNVGDKIMGFAIHYPVSGVVNDMQWNVVNLEWEYYIGNDEGYDGKIKEGKILKFDETIWNDISAKWNRYLQLMKEAAEIESECRKMLRAVGTKDTKKEEDRDE